MDMVDPQPHNSQPPQDGQPQADLLFAWLTPIEANVDKKFRPKSPLLPGVTNSPLGRAKSAFRRTFRATAKAGHVPSFRGHAHKLRVKEAGDACLWLKAAGFPQYVQMFEDGQFPINLSKYQVEKDHDFLSQPDIDSLIRRLNILNRCADLMEETFAKVDDSEDEVNQRALSDKWLFKRKKNKWARRSKTQKQLYHNISYSSSEDLLNDSELETPTESSPLMLVSELRGSLTGLDRAVKTYSFLPTEDNIPSILVDPSSPTQKQGVFTGDSFEGDNNEISVNGHTEEPLAWEEEDELVNSFPRGDMDNFATGILDAFDSNLLKLRTQSLPDVFSASSLFSMGGGSTDTSPLSSNSTSTVSIVESTKSSSIMDSPLKTSYSPSYQFDGKIHSPVMNGHIHLKTNSQSPIMEDKLATDKDDFLVESSTTTRDKRMNSLDSTGTFESRSSPGDSEREEVSVSPLPAFVERRFMQNELPGSAGDLRRTQSDAQSAGRATGGVTLRPKRPSSSKADEPQRARSRWHSYQQPYSIRQAFKPVRTLIPIEELSVGQISLLRKLSLVKLTALIELYNTKSNIARILKTRKQKLPDIKNKRMFGVPLSMNVSHIGQALPVSIQHAFQYLKDNGGLEIKGMFRKPASKARVDQLKEINEADPGNIDYEDYSLYDVADMVKLYYRELPEPILTSQLSETLIIIQENIPSQLRLQALQSVMLLLPDANREALMTLLMFLKEVADNSQVNQMDANNLAVCLAPSLFALSSNLKLATSSLTRKGSFRRNAVSLGLSSNDPASSKEITDSVASSQCLALMITQADKLFMVPADMLQVCKFTHLEASIPVPYHELGLKKSGRGDYKSYVDESIRTLLKESHRKFKGWIHHDNIQGVEVSYLKPRDTLSLRVWRGVVEVPAPCEAVLRVLQKSFIWDGKSRDTKVVAKLDASTEIVQYVTESLSPITDRDHCVLRSWNYDVSTESYVLTSTSVCHPNASLQAGIRATELVTGYLIEPLEGERSKLTYVCRMDMKGRSAEYYNHSFGPYLVSRIGLAVELFKDHDIQETPV